MLYNIIGIKKIFGGRTVLDIDELTIEAEKIYTLIGPNGAGKTTLLSILAFLDLPSQGRVTFCKSLVSFQDRALRQLRQRVVLVDQYPILFTGSVWKNIEFGLKVRRIPKRRRRELVEEVLEMVGMQDFYNSDAHKLSGGETKRIALARALAIQPDVLLCDEPTANVDVENQEIILNILEKCNRENRLSLIFATHYLSQAQRLADQTIVLQNGKLTGASRENVFSVRRVETAEGKQVWQIRGDLYLSDKAPLQQYRHRGYGKTKVIIDPEKIVLSTKNVGIKEKENQWAGTIRKLRQENGRVRVTVDAGLPVDVVMGKDAYRQSPYHIGEEVVLTIIDDSYNFDTR